MKYRHIDLTGQAVSEIGFGVWTLANPHYRPQDVRPEHLLKYALDRGINFFETSDIYGFGKGEELIGNALFEDRERVFLATRFGYDSKEADRVKGWNKNHQPHFCPKHIKKACEASLKRLRTDRIDLYQVHHPDISDVERDDLYDVLQKLQKKGKIISWGASLRTQDEWIEEAKLYLSLRNPAALQVDYHILKPEPGREIIEKVRASNSNIILDMPSKDQVLKHVSDISQLSFLKSNPHRTFWQSFLKFSLLDSVVSSVILDVYSEAQVNELATIGEVPDLTVEEIFGIRKWISESEGRELTLEDDLLSSPPQKIKASTS